MPFPSLCLALIGQFVFVRRLNSRNAIGHKHGPGRRAGGREKLSELPFM